MNEKKPTLNELIKRKNQLTHEREQLPQVFEAKEKQLYEDLQKEEQEIQSLSARQIKPFVERRTVANQAAENSYTSVVAAAQKEYEIEILPAAQRMKAKVAEAELDKKSKRESAMIEFNKASDKLYNDQKVKIEALKQSFTKNLKAAEKEESEKKAAIEAQLNALDLEIQTFTPVSVSTEKKEETAAAPA